MQRYRTHIKETFKLALPVALGQFGYSLMGFVDSAFVGRIGAAQLAASSVGGGIFFLVMVLGLGVSYALTPLVAYSIGSRDIDRCNVLYKQSLILNTISGILLCLLNYFFAEHIYLLNQPEEVTRLAVPFTKMLGLSIIPIMIFQTYKQFMEGLSIVRPAMFMVLGANFINIIINYLLVFGNFGFPRLELIGSSLATLVSRTIMTAALIYFTLNSKKLSHFNLKIFPMIIDYPTCKKILKIGVPSGFQYFFEVGAFSFAALMIGWLGVHDLAAHQVAITMASTTYMLVIGISTAGAIRVGTAAGAGDVRETRKAGFSALLMASCFMVLMGILFLLFNKHFPYLFIKDPKVIEIAAKLITIAAFFQLFDGIQAVSLGILRGLTDVYLPTVITFTAYWIIALPIGYVLGFKMNFNAQGVWLALLIGLAFSATFLSLRFNAISKKQRYKPISTEADPIL